MGGTGVIISGAMGRMGRNLLDVVSSDPQASLEGLLEHQDCLQALEQWRCPASSDPGELLSRAPSAVVIDFTLPAVTMPLVEAAVQHGNPLVTGTTGFSEDEARSLEQAAARIPLFWSPNMSVGLNALLEILPRLTAMLGADYDLEISEIHHKYKKDAPSGTAVKLADTLARARGWESRETRRFCREGLIGERPEKEIGVQTLRGGDMVGEHTVYFLGPGERIDVTHQVTSRETFAKGALRVAHWLSRQQPGKLYSMGDLFYGD